MNYKLIICIESKFTLTGSTGHSAVEQKKKLQSLLEEYFASELPSGQWCFIGTIFTKRVNAKQPICPTCSPFIIHGTSELATKLNGLRAQFRKVRPKQVVPNHPEYVSLVQGLVFVVFSHPISTHCTITSDVHAKVVGKPAKGKAKAKVGQGPSLGPRETSKALCSGPTSKPRSCFGTNGSSFLTDVGPRGRRYS